MGKKRRLKKGFESKSKVIKEHEEKLKRAMKEGDEYLVSYYEKEIKAKKEDRERTLRKLNK